MCGLCLNLWRRWSSAVLAGAVLIGSVELALSACSSGGQAAQAKNAPIGVEASQLSVKIENKSGLALLDTEVAIVAIGGGTAFTHFVGRLDNAETRESALDEFRARDGMRLNLRVVRPKTVRVTAKDLNGKAYNVEVPWQ